MFSIKIVYKKVNTLFPLCKHWNVPFFTLNNLNYRHMRTVYRSFYYGKKKLEMKLCTVECKEKSVKSTAPM